MVAFKKRNKWLGLVNNTMANNTYTDKQLISYIKRELFLYMLVEDMYEML